MDNYKHPRNHNYLKKILRLQQEGKLPGDGSGGGSVHDLEVKHDDWCRLLRDGSLCDCDPDIYDGKRLIA
jgi:hypothetical protein